MAALIRLRGLLAEVLPRCGPARFSLPGRMRCGMETGVDVIKTPYCGDVNAHADIVSESILPVVAAGGPRCETLEDALSMMSDVVKSGAQGATIGRNVWSFPDISGAVRAFKAVIHDGKTVRDAMQAAGG